MIKQRIVEVVDRTPASALSSNPLTVGFVLFSFVVIFAASRFPDQGLVGPGFFPILISVGIIVFGAVEILSETETELETSDFDFGPPAIVLILLVAYVVLMPITGFLVGSMLFLPALLYYSRIRSTPFLVALSIGIPILLFYIFGRIFLVRLPEGIIPVSRLLPQLPLGVVF